MKFENLRKEMIAAMKAHDKDRKEVISSLVSAAKKIAIDEGTREDVTDEQVDRAVTKELRTAKEQLESCPAELKANYADVSASGNKGQIMKTVMPAFKGKADGRVIQQVVAKLLG